MSSDAPGPACLSLVVRPLMIVQYQYITWNPPHLSEAEELELGRQIALVGREHFVKEFRKSIGKSAAESYQTRYANPSPARKAFTYIILGISAVGLFLMTKKDWGNMMARLIPLLVIVLGIYLISLYLATRKFERWIDHLVARYAAHVARGGT